MRVNENSPNYKQTNKKIDKEDDDDGGKKTSK